MMTEVAEDIYLPNPEICQNTVTQSLVNILRIWSLEKCKNSVSRYYPWRDFYPIYLFYVIDI